MIIFLTLEVTIVIIIFCFPMITLLFDTIALVSMEWVFSCTIHARYQPNNKPPGNNAHFAGPSSQPQIISLIRFYGTDRYSYLVIRLPVKQKHSVQPWLKQEKYVNLTSCIKFYLHMPLPFNGECKCIISRYFLLTKFEVGTVSYGPSFAPSIYGPSTKRTGHKSKEKRRGSVTYSAGYYCVPDRCGNDC